MELLTNAGSATTNWMTYFTGYWRLVWFSYPGGIANIIDLINVKEKHRVTYTIQKGKWLKFRKYDGTIQLFNQPKKGLYYLESVESDEHVEFVTMAEQNNYKYTNRD